MTLSLRTVASAAGYADGYSYGNFREVHMSRMPMHGLVPARILIILSFGAIEM